MSNLAITIIGAGKIAHEHVKAINLVEGMTAAVVKREKLCKDRSILATIARLHFRSSTPLFEVKARVSVP